MNLHVELGRLGLANPILVASGTAGYGGELERVGDPGRLGGFVPKTVTLEARAGNPPPRIAETASGMLNAIGLDNDGLAAFLSDHLPRLRDLGCALVASIAGRTVDEFCEMAQRLGEAGGVAAVELNISCPNVAHGIDFSTDPARTEEVVGRVVRACAVPVIAKLSPNVTDIVTIARAAEQGGADAVSLINTLMGMAIDWRTRRPMLSNITGGLSGPAIKPVALRMVWQVARAVRIGVIGIGGIATIDDVMEFLVAGASAVQIGTANFYAPGSASRLVARLTEVLASQGIEDVNDVVGTLVERKG